MDETLTGGGNRLVLGDAAAPIAVFAMAEIESITGQVGVDMVSDTLSIDTMDPTVRYRYSAPQIYAPSGYDAIYTTDGYVYFGHFTGTNLAADVPYGTPLTYYKDGRLQGRYYVEQIERVGADKWSITGMSLIGLFDTQIHVGAIYNGQFFAEVLAQIIGGTVGQAADGLIPILGAAEACYVAEDVAAVKIYGWLPYASRRANLHQLLFATGASLTRDADCSIVIRFVKNTTPAGIAADRLYLGGSVRYDATATGVELTEHSYQWAYTAGEKSLWNNMDAYAEPADHTLTVFTAPVRVDTLRTDGSLVIEESGQNYAVVSGKGTLYGVAYSHITRTVSRHANVPTPGNVKTVTNATLVNALNSENVLARIFDFYTKAQVTAASVLAEGEKAGALYNFPNAFGEATTGFLASMGYTATGITRGECQFITNYVSPAFGNNFNNVFKMVGAGTWWVPVAVRNSSFPFVRITLVGGGEGGDGGEGGEAGKGVYIVGGAYLGHGGGKGGKAGNGGEAGLGGRCVTIAKLDVTNVARIAYQCGLGGARGTRGTGGLDDDTDPVAPGLGVDGTDTSIYLYDDSGALIGSYSSANGYILPSGVINLVDDVVYGLGGLDGVAGGEGGEGGAAAFGSWGGDGAAVAHNGIIYPGGLGSIYEYAYVTFNTLVSYCGGGGGGGAALGTAGEDSPQKGTAIYQACSWGGDGGDGATPSITPTKPSVHGQGGDGGHGGGGGGSGGSQNWRANGGFNSGMRDGFLGIGGDGTDGADGADGCGFVYF